MGRGEYCFMLPGGIDATEYSRNRAIILLIKLLPAYVYGYCTLTEMIKELNISRMQLQIDGVYSWSSLNHMNINIKKTEEIVQLQLQRLI